MVVIESDDPQSVRLLNAEASLFDGNDMLFAALWAIKSSRDPEAGHLLARGMFTMMKHARGETANDLPTDERTA